MWDLTLQRVVMHRLPWSAGEYQHLEPGDLDPSLPPTPEKRVRIAAALATEMRDAAILGTACIINAEAIRAVLVMDEDTWARDIGKLKGACSRFDAVDPRRRFDEARGFRLN